MQLIKFRFLLSLFWIALGALVEAPAWAQAPEDVDQCVASFDAVQTLRDEGKLRSARADAGLCADPSCPQAIRDKCVAWIAELDATIPSILVSARDPSGRDTAAVRVLELDTVLAERLDGRPIELDPGPHALRFELAGALPVEETVVLHVGAKGRLISVVFRAAPPGGGTAVPRPTPTMPAPRGDGGEPTAEASFSPLFWVGVGMAGAGLVIGAVAGGIAIGNKSDLDAQCATVGCTSADITSAELPAHVSTFGFALAGAGAALGAIALVVWWPFGDDEATGGTTPLVSLELFAQPTGVSLVGRF